MYFAQTDNAGKNAMFDFWVETSEVTNKDLLELSKVGKWYPRPYDMDTELGLSNTGRDNISSGVEINNELSLSPGSVSDTERYAYGTKWSRLWTQLGKAYKENIKTLYGNLMSSVYNSSRILSFVNNLTYNVIGESYYNRDAYRKYINITKENEQTHEIEPDKGYLYTI